MAPGLSVPGWLCCRGTFQQLAEEEGEENPLLVPLEEKSVLDERQTTLWFRKVSAPAGQEGPGPGVGGVPAPVQRLQPHLGSPTLCWLEIGLRWLWPVALWWQHSTCELWY